MLESKYSGSLTDEISRLGDEELAKVLPRITKFIAVPLYLFATLVDLKLIPTTVLTVGLRLGILPLSFIALFLFKRSQSRIAANWVIITFAAYIEAALFYFAAIVGDERSSFYYAGIEQVILAISFLAIRPRVYFSFIAITFLSFSSILIVLGQGVNSLTSTEMNQFIIFVTIGSVNYFLANRNRNALYQKTLELKREVESRDEIITIKARELTDIVLEKERRFQEIKKLDALAELSAQVAHDIRSPLAALSVATANLATSLPSDDRELLKSATLRIQDIANVLISQFKAHQTPQVSLNSHATQCNPPILISEVIETLVSEKRCRQKNAKGKKIATHFSGASLTAFVSLNYIQLNRVLSNLLDNSLEAVSETCGVSAICLDADSNNVFIEIADNGKGIPPELLKELGTKVISYDKPGGSGLGVYSAFQSCKENGWELSIESEVGKGTLVKLVVPITSLPAWFQPRVEYPNGGTLVVVDNDWSVHHIWRNRLRSSALNGERINLVSLFSPAMFKEWYSNTVRHGLHRTKFFVDYDFSSEDEDGLTLISQLGIAANAVLVTSYYSIPEVIERCEAQSLKVIPKKLLGDIEFVATKEA